MATHLRRLAADDLMTIDCRNVIGECATWCWRTGRFWWVDIFGPSLNEYDPGTSMQRRHTLPGQTLGSFALHENGSLLVALDASLKLFDPATGTLTGVAEPEAARPDRRFNDGRCDRNGRFWVGAMDREANQPSGIVYRLDPDGRCTPKFSGFAVPNSAAFSPDGSRYYFSDCRNKVIWKFRLDAESGDILEKGLFFDASDRQGQPDGSCVDEDGCLWNTECNGGRLTRYTPQGRIDRVIELPVSKPTSCAFGGKNLDRLFVTTGIRGLTNEQLASQPLAGRVLVFDAGVRGVPEPYFGGHQATAAQLVLTREPGPF